MMEVYMYEWNEHEDAFRIYEQEFIGHTVAYMPEDYLAREILTQYQNDRRYIAADPGSYVRMVHAIAMKVFVHYKEDKT